LDVAIFDITRNLLSVWKISSDYHDQKIDSFRDCGYGRWLIKFESKKYTQTLILLSIDRPGEHNLFIESELDKNDGRLVRTDIDKIQTWFSDEDASPKFFILIGGCCFCSYALRDGEHSKEYEKISNISMSSRIKEFKAVEMNGSFAVDIKAETIWSVDSSFFLNFKL